MTGPIEPDKPNQNAYVECFNGWLRHERLNEHWFTSPLHARTVIEALCCEYNKKQSKNTLGGLTPEAYANILIGLDTSDSKADRY